MRTNLSAPGKYTGVLNQEKFTIGRKIFYDFNWLIFDEDSEELNHYYKNILENLKIIIKIQKRIIQLYLKKIFL